ncbi:MipA/OmpV family protein [Pseudemcibacter aquimaris]|uniref:MipA/OmpV family protein n=1 Tax=Pseudemcibacter aquimaris TaxID=2857064 RepID=UPI00201242A3|nr:MipA/OmpV family protein [Pseudemcibacter aquimaris]MCC3861153.1 MipA/OmpV family protein [Pseudemcibacter aquimaris]WDU59970.1 MipA/OmpV family protein [Pseudemcibacter aquimaris]
MKQLLFVILLLLPCLSFAKDEIDNKEHQKASEGLWNYKRFLLDENGKWSVGAGAIIRNSPFKGEKVDITPIPMIDYSSKNLFIRGLRAGYHIKRVTNFREGDFFLDGFISPRMRPGDSRRKLTLDGGLSGGYQSIFGALTLSAQQNLTGGNGTELSANYTLRLGTRNRVHSFMPSVSLIWQSERMANHMWGIDQQTYLKTLANPNEVTLDPYHINGSILNYQAAMTYVYRIDDHWNVMTSANITALADKITDNPAVEKNFDYGFILGVAYTF